MTVKTFVDNFVIRRTVDRYVARERKKERKRLARRRREIRKIRKIARRVNDPDLYML